MTVLLSVCIVVSEQPLCTLECDSIPSAVLDSDKKPVDSCSHACPTDGVGGIIKNFQEYSPFQSRYTHHIQARYSFPSSGSIVL